MKRTLLALVSYSSSSDEDEQPIPKKLKLPPLPSSFTPALPVDNPVLHQGRIRTTPHVEGQFAAYAYISLRLELTHPLHALINDVFAFAKRVVPSLLEIGSENVSIPGSTYIKKGRELHLSLSRPIYLRAHQRQDLRRAIKSLAENSSPFTGSFAVFTGLTNDEKTRAFIAMEVGAGHSELRALSDALTPTLRSIRQKEFYTDPRFHASIAWALLDKRSTEVPGTPESSPQFPIITDDAAPLPSNFKGISHLPDILLSSINQEYGHMLASRSIGSFEVGKIHVKIGKEVSAWRMSG